jgi:hypothetical protein
LKATQLSHDVTKNKLKIGKGPQVYFFFPLQSAVWDVKILYFA